MAQIFGEICDFVVLAVGHAGEAGLGVTEELDLVELDEEIHPFFVAEDSQMGAFQRRWRCLAIYVQ